MSESAPRPPRPRGADWQLLRRYWPFVRAERGWLLAGLLAVPLMSAAGLLQPWLVKEAIDGPLQTALRPQNATALAATASPATDDWSLAAVAVAFLIAVLAEYGFRGLQLFALQQAGYRSLARLRRAVYSHVLGQGGRFFDTRNSGSLLTRTTTDVEALGEVLTFGIIGIIGDVIDIVAILAMMVALDLRLTLTSLLVAPLVVAIVQVFRRQLRIHSTEIRRSMSAASGHFQEALAGARIVQLSGRQQATLDEYKALNHRYLDAYRKSNWYDASLYAVMDGVASLCIALLIWFGGGRALLGSGDAVSVGLLVAFIQYIQRVFVPVRELSAKVATIERAFAALERIFGLLDTDERLPAGSHAPTSVRGDLDLDHLDFSYDGKHRVLHDVCLHVEAGQVLALVGPTGSGKSTIGKLLTRLYAAPQGSVRVDGVAVEQWQPQALRRAIGVVQQDVVLFAASLRDNVDLGRGLDDAVIQRALEDACLGDLVQRLGGLHAQPGEGGTGLSAGERQLLSIARVLAANPAVVVLDEATSSIDSLTEQKVQAAIARVLHGRTAVVVAHRLSTVRQAQQIAVLERGRVVACGNHEALMAEDGLYAGLVQAAERQGHLA